MKSFVRLLLALVLLVAIAGGVVAYSIASRGLSTRVEPSGAEKFIARTMRTLAVPAAVRSKPNPVQPSDAVLQEGLEHFADHCATCHGNDGRGNTEIGGALYPRAPDMRAAATQDLSDGELFTIIENGVRLTGMPAWGDGSPEGEHASWVLVHFIRHIPKLTEDEIAHMEGLNPKSPDEWREDEEARHFLEGSDDEAHAPSAHHHGGH